MLDDADFNAKVYQSGVKWIEWLENNRMTRKTGLVEMFVGFDTGHDNSARLDGLSCKGYYIKPDGKVANASVLPENDEVAPIIAVDMNCNYFANLMALSDLAKKIGLNEDAAKWQDKAHFVKNKLFEICYDKEDAFFYDVDKNGNKRKYKSCTVFHLFMEGVLDKSDDADVISEIYNRHIKNQDEFWTPFPFPSMAVNDKSCQGHPDFNCWGYYTQGLIVFRCTRWMDKYGMGEDFDFICEKWVEVWTKCFDYFKLGQEIDPITGKPTKSSQWYSSTMLAYLYAVKRLEEKRR